MRKLNLERNYSGYPISCELTALDEGIHVLIVGGCSTHIGSISTAEPGKELQTTVFPGHKDYYIGDSWAKAISQKAQCRVTVVCGIHYDRLSTRGIQDVVALSFLMLEELDSADTG